MAKSGRRNWKNANPLVVNQEGILVGTMSRPTIFYDAQPPRNNLVLDSIVQKDDAIGNVFFDTEPGQLAAPSFGRDDCGDALVFEPAEQPTKFCAEDSRVCQTREQCFDRVQNDPLRSNRIDCMPESDEQ